MPFQRNPQQGARPPQGSAYRDPNDPKPVRLGPLWYSKSGNTMMGNVNVTYQNKHGEFIGDTMMQMIQDAMDRNVPLRFLIFENNGKFREPGDGSLHVTFGNPPRQSDTQSDGRNQPQPQPQRFRRNPGPPPPPFPEPPQEEEYQDSIPDDSDPDQPEPEPEPVPRRRVTRR